MKNRIEHLARAISLGMCVVLGVVLSGTQVSAAEKAPPIASGGARPNVLIIMADDLGYGDLSCYGGKDIQTPHLDKLMSEGMRFTEFYANSCVCSPSRAALLTGRYPELVGVPGVIRHYAGGNWGCLAPDSIVLPTLFQKSGYHTTLIGKWHLGLEKPNLPNQRGFDEFHGWIADMMDSYTKHRRGGANYMRHNEEVIDPPGHATDLFTQWSMAELRQRAQMKQAWFQFLAYTAPHFPVEPPEEWLGKVKAREKGITETRAKIVALIEHLDHCVGQVLQAVDDLGQRGNTIIVFTSDNGGDLANGASNGPLRSGKGHVYEGGLKVPTSVCWPGRVKPGQRTDFRALTMDIIPTLADICGVPISHHIEGRSFKRLLLEGSQPQFERPVFHMYRDKKLKDAMRNGDWKLVRDEAGAPVELYNIKNDFGEKVNLAPQETKRLIEMTKALDSHMEAAQRIPWKKGAMNANNGKRKNP